MKWAVSPTQDKSLRALRKECFGQAIDESARHCLLWSGHGRSQGKLQAEQMSKLLQEHILGQGTIPEKCLPGT